MAEPLDAGLVFQGLLVSFAQYDADVFHRVVVVDRQVAGGFQTSGP